MAVIFITGLPRNGKTLFTVDHLVNKSRAENRPVYYHHINMLLVPSNWHKLENPDDWWNLPDGSIIYFDECHHLFPNRSSTSRIPENLKLLNEHGHKGFDLYFISQQPKYVDPQIKGLAQEHWNVIRVWGRAQANVYKWIGTKEKPETKQAKADSFARDTYNYNKKYYEYYESASQHNVKANVPFKYKLLYIIPLVILALLIKVGMSWNDQIHKEKPVDEIKAPVVQDLQESKPIKNELPPGGFVTTNIQSIPWLERFKPEVEGVPESAAAYNELTKATVYPKPQVCVASKSRCQCYTQQATIYHTTDQICRQIVKDGYFDNTPAQTQYAQAPSQDYSQNRVDTVPRIEPISVDADSFKNMGAISPGKY